MALKSLLAIVLWACGLASAVHANEAAALADNPQLEARMLAITAELRCLVCQNQTIADSHADLAIDLRQQVRQLLQQGQTNQQIRDYMTARYGDFVLYRPPFRANTYVLWLGPVLMMVLGLGILVAVLRRRSRMSADCFDADDQHAPAAAPAEHNP